MSSNEMRNQKKIGLWIAWMMQAALILAAGAARGEQVRVYPAPQGEPLSTSYTVTADEASVPVYRAKVAAADPFRRWKAMDDKVNSAMYHDWASFATFDMQRPVKITVTAAVPVESVKILPSSYGITPAVEGKRITFTLDKPRLLVLEINGNWVNSLQLFANPPETDVPDPKDPNVIYYGPGIHEVDSVQVTAGKTVYVAGGAVVRGRMKPGMHSGPVFALTGDNITLRGRGIIDGGLCPTHTRNMIYVHGNNIRLEDVIVRDSSTWNIPVRGSEHVRIQNLKVLGYRANSDGIDICNSRDVEVTGCFLRTLDDLVVIKADKGRGESSNITVTNCVLWNEVAHALSIGAELRENVHHVHFADCDVIHDKGREWALRVYHCDSSRISDVVFENIRIEETRKAISLWIGSAVWTKDAERGHIDGVTFRDIHATGDQPKIELKGFDAGHAVENARFDRVTINGQPLKAGDVKQNAFVRGVSVQP